MSGFIQIQETSAERRPGYFPISDSSLMLQGVHETIPHGRAGCRAVLLCKDDGRGYGEPRIVFIIAQERLPCKADGRRCRFSAMKPRDFIWSLSFSGSGLRTCDRKSNRRPFGQTSDQRTRRLPACQKTTIFFSRQREDSGHCSEIVLRMRKTVRGILTKLSQYAIIAAMMK